jgi:response regulator of citrate/malate metabolism
MSSGPVPRKTPARRWPAHPRRDRSSGDGPASDTSVDPGRHDAPAPQQAGGSRPRAYPVRVLVVEEEPTTARLLVEHVERLPGFEVTGQPSTGADALRRLATEHVDLVLLDVRLPDMSGLELLRRLRGGGCTVDVVAVTGAHDLRVVRTALAFGVVHYLLKPVTFTSVRQQLERYEAYRSLTTEGELVLVQQGVDRLLGMPRDADEDRLPKGISRESLQAIIAALRGFSGTGGGVSAAEVAQDLGTSRVTTRRYLEYLVDRGSALRRARYRGPGRPELEYVWLSPDA